MGQILWKAAILALIGLVAAMPAHAATKAWRDRGSSNWHSDHNWNPHGVPGHGDDVRITRGLVELRDHSARLDDLLLGAGTVRTKGFKLRVNDAGSAQATIGSASGSSALLRVDPRDGGSAGFQADVVDIRKTGEVMLNGAGSKIQVDVRMANRGHLHSAGSGTKTVNFMDPVSAFSNGGTIIASGGRTHLNAVNGGKFDLDGDTISFANLSTNRIEVSSTATLTVDALLTDSFGGRIAVGDGGSEATLDMRRPWAVSDGGLIGLSGRVNLADGHLTGATLTNGGFIGGSGRITTQNLDNNGAIAASGGTLVIDTVANWPDLDGSEDTGRLRAVDGDLEVILGPGASAFAGTIDVGTGRELRHPRFNIILVSGSVVNLTGGSLIGGGLSVSPGGTLNVLAGPESRIESSGSNFFSETARLDGNLRLAGDTFVNASALFLGQGDLIIDARGSFSPQAEATITTDLINEGVLSPGGAGRAAARLGADYTQTESGTFAVDIAGPLAGTDHDALGVAGAVELAGTLEIDLRDGFIPGLGDRFNILTGPRTGRFSQVTGQSAGPGHWFVPQYDPSGVTLVVAPLLAGDANNDGAVTGADLVAIHQNFARTGAADGLMIGDANDDGMVTGADLLTVRQNFAALLELPGSGAITAPVPEPASLVLIAVGLILVKPRRPGLRSRPHRGAA